MEIRNQQRRRRAPLLVCIIQAASFLLLVWPIRSSPVEYCDKKGNYSVAIKGVEINPNPIARGKPAFFKIDAVAEGGDISQGKLVIDVKFLGMHIHREKRDLCELTNCPVSAGDFVLLHEETLPSFTPPGSYVLIMKMLGEEDRLLTCFSFDFGIGFLSPIISDPLAQHLV